MHNVDEKDIREFINFFCEKATKVYTQEEFLDEKIFEDGSSIKARYPQPVDEGEFVHQAKERLKCFTDKDGSQYYYDFARVQKIFEMKRKEEVKRVEAKINEKIKGDPNKLPPDYKVPASALSKEFTLLLKIAVDMDEKELESCAVNDILGLRIDEFKTELEQRRRKFGLFQIPTVKTDIAKAVGIEDVQNVLKEYGFVLLDEIHSLYLNEEMRDKIFSPKTKSKKIFVFKSGINRHVIRASEALSSSQRTGLVKLWLDRLYPGVEKHQNDILRDCIKKQNEFLAKRKANAAKEEAEEKRRNEASRLRMEKERQLRKAVMRKDEIAAVLGYETEDFKKDMYLQDEKFKKIVDDLDAKKNDVAEYLKKVSDLSFFIKMKDPNSSDEEKESAGEGITKELKDIEKKLSSSPKVGYFNKTYIKMLLADILGGDEGLIAKHIEEHFDKQERKFQRKKKKE